MISCRQQFPTARRWSPRSLSIPPMYNLRFAFRQLVKSPGFTAVSVITLALGIGVNTTIFSMLDAFIYRMPPFREQNRVVTLTATSAGNMRGGLSLANVKDL